MEASTGRWMLMRGKIMQVRKCEGVEVRLASSRSYLDSICLLHVEVRLRGLRWCELDLRAGAKFLRSLNDNEFPTVETFGDLDLPARTEPRRHGF